MLKLRPLLAWIALVAVFSTIVFVLVAADLQAISASEDHYAQRRSLLDRLNALPTKEARIKEHLENLSSEAADQYLYSENQRAVQARIQQDIRGLTRASKVSLSSVRSLSSPKLDDLIQRSSVQLSFTATTEPLLSFLDAIERQSPMLQVRRISVKVQKASTETAAAQLSVTMEVSGFRRNTEGDR